MLQTIIAEVNDLIHECERSWNLKEADWKPFLTDERLIPSVTMLNDTEALIHFCRWGDWSGLDSYDYHAYYEGRTIRFEHQEPVNLLKYDCGNRF